MHIISIYEHQKHSLKGTPFDIDVFFNQIQKGTYKDKVEEIRMLKYNFKLEEKRCEFFTPEEISNDQKYQKSKHLLKEKKGLIPRITVGGKFSDEGRLVGNLLNPSGLIDIDIDRIDDIYELKSLKKKLISDPYCYACFITCGGDGLSFICRVDNNKWDESWDGLKEYFFTSYGISIDLTHKSIANTRNASYDPEIFICGNKPPVFKKYPKPKKPTKAPVINYVYAKNDFEEIIQEIVHRRLDFCPDYDTYLSIGFAIGSQFGSSGLQYFDSVCQFGQKYNPKTLEKDYKYYCANPNKGIKIATFYSRCKEFNIQTTSKKTSRIASVASASRKGGKTKEDTIKNIVKFEDFSKEDCEDIVNQVFDNKIEFSEGESTLDEIEIYIKHNYNLIKNQITGKLENEGVEWSEEDVNGLHISIKKAIDKADSRWIDRILFSPSIKSYNPIQDFFLANLDKTPDHNELLDKHEIPSIIKKLWNSVNTNNPGYTEKFGTKWIISIIASAFGQPSNLELDFTGKQNKGKSWFFKNLLPVELRKYFAETKLDSNNSNDDYTAMCQYLLILMDECAGKTRSDEKKHRNLLDKEIFSLRRPYRKDFENMKRLAVLCGTSNPQNLLTGDNRRIIPIDVISRDFKMFDSIDKTELFMAAYYLWKEGFEWQIKESDIEELNQATLIFQDYTMEYELINHYYEKTEKEYLTAGEIKIFLEGKSQQKLSLTKVSSELKRLEFKLEVIRVNGIPKNVYRIRVKDGMSVEVVDVNPRYEVVKNVDYF